MHTGTLSAALALLALAGAFSPAGAAELSGRPEVISGDTLVLAGTRLRLYGVDAPEAGQSCWLASGRAYDCGRISTTALMDLTAGVSITCRPRAAQAARTDKTGKTDETDNTEDTAYATCFAGGYDLSHGMTHTGWALAWPAAGTPYVRVQEAARKARRGLWRGAFVAPWEWRGGKRLPAP